MRAESLRRFAPLLVVLLSACGHAPTRHAPPPRESSSLPRESGSRVPAPPTVRDGPAPWAERDGGPPIPPDVSAVKEPVPRAEPRSAFGNKSPASCSVVNWSNGWLSLNARITQSRQHSCRVCVALFCCERKKIGRGCIITW